MHTTIISVRVKSNSKVIQGQVVKSGHIRWGHYTSRNILTALFLSWKWNYFDFRLELNFELCVFVCTGCPKVYVTSIIIYHNPAEWPSLCNPHLVHHPGWIRYCCSSNHVSSRDRHSICRQRNPISTSLPDIWGAVPGRFNRYTRDKQSKIGNGLKKIALPRNGTLLTVLNTEPMLLI